jgi:hypothetical protein
LRRASFVGDSVGEGIELQVQGMRWLLGREQERVIWCGTERGNRSLRDVPRAVKMAIAVVRPSFLSR